jgi:hypothetical protein
MPTRFLALAPHQSPGALHLDFEMWDSTAFAPDLPQQGGYFQGDLYVSLGPMGEEKQGPPVTSRKTYA